MKPFIGVIALALAAISMVNAQQRPRSGRQGGQQVPRQYGAPPQPAPLPAYDQPQADASSLSQAQESHDHDHQGLDWLIDSVPGTPDTDYPIFAQEALSDFTFDCAGKVEGGYYANTGSRCQAFHVCVPSAEGGLSTISFLCPNGTIFNQGYFICDWWFNFDCAEAEGLYGKNDEVAAERESASLSQGSHQSASNAAPTYSQPAAAPAQPQYQQQPAQPAQSGYSRG